MKVIAQTQNGIRHTCGKCNTVLEYVADDVKRVAPVYYGGRFDMYKIDGYNYIICPVCGSKEVVK